MKKTLLLTLIGTVATASQAQITLTMGNVAQSPTFQANVSEGSGTIDAPGHGANRNWDYSTLQADFSGPVNYRPATRTGFTGFTRYYNGSAYLGMIPLPSEYYTHITAEGLFEVGSYKLPQAVGVGSFSGNNADSLKFAGSNNIFSSPAPLLKFPCTYGSTWNADHVFNTPFSLTVSAFFLNNTPGSQRQRVYKTDSVVGWGKLILPTSSGPSNPADVLLIKTSKFYVDSYFLNGNPAPAALLTAFGLAQSDTSYQHSYEFYAAGGELPLLSIWMDEDWEAFGFQYRSNGVFPLAGNSLQTQSRQVYPNPVQAGQLLRFGLPAISSQVHVSILDMQGRQVHNWAGDAATAGNGIRIPAALSPGRYIYSVTSNGTLLQNGKITVE